MLSATIPAEATHSTVLAESDERDMWQRAALARERAAYRRGHAAGVEEGRRAEAAERDAAWHAFAAPVVKHLQGPSFAELERRRWGPGGRAHFGDPRPGDFTGRG